MPNKWRQLIVDRKPVVGRIVPFREVLLGDTITEQTIAALASRDDISQPQPNPDIQADGCAPTWLCPKA